MVTIGSITVYGNMHKHYITILYRTENLQTVLYSLENCPNSFKLYLRLQRTNREGSIHMDIVAIISQVGFPIAVAVYSLVVLNKTVQRNTDVMQRIAAKLDIPCEDVDATKKEVK
jgi:hypothetical protein